MLLFRYKYNFNIWYKKCALVFNLYTIYDFSLPRYILSIINLRINETILVD